jgi:hypothetical protein
MKKAAVKTSLRKSQMAADLAYWLAQPVQARIDALETLRLQHWQGQLHADTRVQRVCLITQLNRLN